MCGRSQSDCEVSALSGLQTFFLGIDFGAGLSRLFCWNVRWVVGTLLPPLRSFGIMGLAGIY